MYFTPRRLSWSSQSSLWGAPSKVNRSTRESFAAFEQSARAMEEVLECVLVAGEVDYFLRIRVRDLPAFNRLHSERIIAMPGVRQVRTFFVLDEVKTDSPLPI